MLSILRAFGRPRGPVESVSGAGVLCRAASGAGVGVGFQERGQEVGQMAGFGHVVGGHGGEPVSEVGDDCVTGDHRVDADLGGEVGGDGRTGDGYGKHKDAHTRLWPAALRFRFVSARRAA